MVDTAHSLHPIPRERLPIAGVLSTTFQVFGKAPLTFLLLGLISQLVVLGGLLVSPPTTPNLNLPAIIVLVGTLLLSFLLQTALIYTAVRLRSDQPATIGDALALGIRRYLPMLGTSLLFVLSFYIGLLLLIVPGIIVAIWFAVAVQACAVEGLGPIDSIKRSLFLTKGERWRILGIYCLFFIPLMILSGIITFGLTMRGHLALGQLLSSVIQIVWLPLATIVSALIYTELRHLKENVGVASIFD